jgi:hypothetical protein
MSLFDVVLFLHIAAAISAFALSGVIHTAEWLLKRSSTAGEALRMARVNRLAPLFSVLIVLLLGLGSWLVQLSEDPDKFSFGDPFVYTALVVLAVLFVDGPLILGRHGKALGAALAQSPDGTITPQARALMDLPLPPVVSYANTFVVLAVVFNMAVKPSLVGCLASIALGLLLGLWVGRISARPMPTTSAAVEPA